MLRIQQIQVKNCTAVAWYFIAGAPEFVLHYHTVESGEKKVYSNTTLLHCAFFQNSSLRFWDLQCQRIQGGLPCHAKFGVMCSLK